MKDFTREIREITLVLRPRTLEGIHCSNVGQGDTTSTNPGGLTMFGISQVPRSQMGTEPLSHDSSCSGWWFQPT